LVVADIDAKRTRVEADAALIKARGDADVALVKARADAEVRMLATIAIANELIVAHEVNRRTTLGDYYVPRPLRLMKPSDFA
jgi:hypothetical protein